jgi:hypothetical protein
MTRPRNDRKRRECRKQLARRRILKIPQIARAAAQSRGASLVRKLGEHASAGSALVEFSDER